MESKLLYGTDTIAEIMKKETMKHEPFVSPNQKYSAHNDPREGINKDDTLYPNGKKRFDQNKERGDDEDRAHHAAGGVAKQRLGYPNTIGRPGINRGY